MTNVVGQQIEPAVEAACPLIKMQCAEKVYRAGTLEYAGAAAVDVAIWPGDMVTVVGPSGCSREPFGPMGW